MITLQDTVLNAQGINQVFSALQLNHSQTQVSGLVNGSEPFHSS